MIGIGIGVPRFRNAGGGETPPAPSLLLDAYPDAAAAYSLRQLSTSYDGPAITLKVLDGGGNPEHQVSFVDGVIDTNQIVELCGPFEGVVAQWWDQSGNNRHASQANILSMPKIYQVVEGSGSVILENGKPSLQFDGSNDNLVYGSNLFTGAGERTILTVYKPNNSTGIFTYSQFGQSNTSPISGNWTVLQSRTEIVTGDPYFAGFSADLGNGLSTPNTSQKLAQFNYNGTTGYLYKNNTLLTSGNITLNAASTGVIYIGASTAMNEYSDSNIQECIAWTSNQDSNTSGISNNINDFYSIYP